jgi:NAD(P)-dependent dehydrogenase (short-subunit alcohol dehydrogenase family)
MASLDGHHAIVTGGGAAVTVVGRKEAALAAAAAAGDAAGYVIADVTDARALRQEIERAAALRGPIAILVANAGGAESAPFARSDDDLFRRMLDLNLMGVVHATHAVLTGMMARGFGRIVAVASTAGLKGYPYVTAYCAAKHAVVGLVRALALETARTGVTVNAVCPGYTDTDLVRQSLDRIEHKTGRPREEALAAMIKDNPLGRLIRPEEVAAAVLALCASDAAAITGETLAVAGGEV